MKTFLRGQPDYRLWAIELKSTAQLLNVWRAISGTDKAVTQEAADVVALKAREEMAIGLITRTVSLHLKLELSEYVVNVTTTSSGTTITTKREASAAELWQHIKGKASSRSEMVPLQ